MGKDSRNRSASRHAAPPAGADGDGPVGDRRALIERRVETDPALVPVGPSALLVESAVLDPEEVRALLAPLSLGQCPAGGTRGEDEHDGRRRGEPDGGPDPADSADLR